MPKQSIIELTTLTPSLRYSILYHHKIGEHDYFSLKTNNNRYTYFTFVLLDKISIHYIVYETAEELINAFNFEFDDEKIEDEILFPIRSKFTLVQKITNNNNGLIEYGDYAKGFGPGANEELEWWPCAVFLNITNDNDVNNYLNYKPVSVTLPNT